MSVGMFQPGSQSPLTTKGDIYVFGTGDTKLPVGADGQVLTADSTQSLGVKYAPVSAAAVLTTSAAKVAGFTAVGNNLYTLDASGGTFTTTLAAASSYSGQILALKRTDNTPTKLITVAVNGSTTVHMATQNEDWMWISDGAAWQEQSHKTKTPWLAYGMTVTSDGTTNPIAGAGVTLFTQWQRDGQNMLLSFFLNVPSSPGGSNGNGTFLWPLPSGPVADSGVMVINTNTSGAHPGTGIAAFVQQNAGTPVGNEAYMYNTTNMKFYATGVGYYGSVHYGFTNELSISFIATIPIANWEP